MKTTISLPLTHPLSRPGKLFFLLLLWLLPLLIGCGSAGETSEATEAAPPPSATPTESATPPPTDTPTATTLPTATATETPLPSPSPTEAAFAESTPTRSQPPPASAETPLATAQPLEGDDGPDPLQLIAKAEPGMRRLQSVTVRQSTTFEMVGLRQSQNQTCQARPSRQNTYCVTETTVAFGDSEPMETYMELVQQGDRFWVREDADGDWEELPAEALEESGLSMDSVTDLRIGDHMTTAALAGTTILDGAPVYEITFALDVATYFQALLGEEAGRAFLDMATSSEADGRLWIGQEDFLLRRANVEMRFTIEGETVSALSQAAYTGFDEPVDIPDPTAGN